MKAGNYAKANHQAKPLAVKVMAPVGYGGKTTSTSSLQKIGKC